jgi:hypothetical protein
MPIRLCQKCGLKVLIDESQAGTNPFYCQRCTTAMKGQENAAPAAPAALRNPTPSPVSMANRSDPAAPSVSGAAKAATVRVLCPYCKASFNGRVPQKPARGSCPVCQKELILLPNGDIKPAAGFDLGNWQNEPAPAKSPESEPDEMPEPKESGTRLLVKKYAAESQPAPRPAAKRAEPVSAPADTDVSDENNPLPGWLDDSAQGGGGSPPVSPQPETDTNIDVVEPPKAEEPVDEVPPPPPPPPARARSPIAAKQPSLVTGRPPASVAPPPLAPEPEVDLLPPDPPPRKQTARLNKPPLSSRPAAEPVGVGGGEETGGGKVFLALFLTILPIAACAGLLVSRDKLNNDLVMKVGKRFTVGFGKLHLKLFPPPVEKPAPKPVEKAPDPEPPKEEPPKPDPEQQKKDEQKISHINDEVNSLSFQLKKAGVAANPEQQKSNDELRRVIEEKKAKIKDLREIYQKMYGKDYDPQKQ